MLTEFKLTVNVVPANVAAGLEPAPYRISALTVLAFRVVAVTDAQEISPVLGLYVSGPLTLSTNRVEVDKAPAQKTRLYAKFALLVVVDTVLEVVAIDAVVAFPNKSPLNSLHARREFSGS
jgi:hypothetical protein